MREANANDPNGNLFFLPAGSYYSDVCAAADILFLPSRLDPLPNVVFDAARNGCTTVMFKGATGFDDARYNPFPRNVTVGANRVDRGGTDPQLDGAAQLLAAFGGALPPVLWDGLAQPGTTALRVEPGLAGWSLNLTEQGKGLGGANPGPLNVPAPDRTAMLTGVGAPAALEARLHP